MITQIIWRINYRNPKAARLIFTRTFTGFSVVPDNTSFRFCGAASMSRGYIDLDEPEGKQVIVLDTDTDDETTNFLDEAFSNRGWECSFRLSANA